MGVAIEVLKLFETVKIPTWVKRAARKDNIEGPNGSEVIAYEWRWKGGLKWSARDGGEVDAKVSDWDRSERCVTCNREIVHVYWVRNKEGDTKPYGGDHLHVALGYDRELDKSRLEKIKRKVTTKEEADIAEKERRESIIKAMALTIPEANVSFGKRFPGFDPFKNAKQIVWFFNKNTSMIYKTINDLLPSMEPILKDLGFERSTPKDIRGNVSESVANLGVIPSPSLGVIKSGCSCDKKCKGNCSDCEDCSCENEKSEAQELLETFNR